ncbi:hypothetical protein AMJ39_03845 [candidate division TA06 bacterium DG_24]|jgi:cell division transport system ATP-binding protein|uniref:Cell division ATP-binding protein FtsE n=3 Tax=Bacteria division TA06 TaxID=1156500 RepID=A0A0S8JM81_UNCT6|nr:MAG: hypothetical protein AMJ39_03845 [candidate division TA06 bacterium DG_24]KPK69227.1 MAG: cell division ATP-binding protein FtsE [candidate division TA06 bacterium SM23_40]KPL10339.1 MAG: cell division ATP-binding protein FtsE [candidate division TA06 bacterium SM1_40]
MIELNHVHKVYRGDWVALNDVSFAIGKGEFAFIVGPSGAGKSTLLRLLYIEERPTNGTVVVVGFDTARIKREEIPLLRRKLGVVFQDVKLLPDRNAYENVAFALEVTGVRRSEVRSRALDALGAVGMRHKWDALPYQLSAGEQQKVALARAIAREPVVLLADEPTGNIDEDGAREIVGLLADINARGTAVVMATHDFSIVEKTSSRVIYLDSGEIRGEERSVGGIGHR